MTRMIQMDDSKASMIPGYRVYPWESTHVGITMAHIRHIQTPPDPRIWVYTSEYDPLYYPF